MSALWCPGVVSACVVLTQYGPAPMPCEPPPDGVSLDFIDGYWALAEARAKAGGRVEGSPTISSAKALT